MQLYIHCKFHNMATSRDVLERCIQDIGHWMLANHLKLNPDKAELLCTGIRHSLSRLTDCRPLLVLGTKVINASSCACLLGVTFTPDCLEKHASIISGRCFFPAMPATTCMMFTRLVGSINFHTLIRLQPSWLLQLFNGGSIQKVDRKTPTVMNVAARILTDEEVGQGADLDTPWRAAQAKHFRVHLVQALHPCLQVPAWHSTKIHDGSMLTCICNWGTHSTQSPAFSGERAAWCTPFKAVNIWKKGFLIHWSISMDLTVQLP